MISVLIADDEKFIRQGIRHTVPWEKNGMTVVGEASDGEEAIKNALELRPDIMLLDINMPVKNGIEVAKELNKIAPSIRIIFLTAYDTQENLKAAINMKTSAFILKSADSQKILDEVLEVKREIEQNQDITRKQHRLQNLYDENYNLIKSSLLNDLVAGKIEASEFISKLQMISQDIPQNNFKSLMLHYKKGMQWDLISRLSAASDNVETSLFFIAPDILFAIFSSSICDDMVDKIYHQVKSYVCNNQITFYSKIHSWNEIPQVFMKLKQAQNVCFWDAKSDYILADAMDFDSTKYSQTDIYKLEQNILRALIFNNISELHYEFNKYKEFTAAKYVSKEDLVASASRLKAMIEVGKANKGESPYQESIIRSCNTAEELFDSLQQMVFEVEKTSNNQIQSALDYISDHYADDIKLKEVADHVFVSEGYMSRMIKQNTGYSFKDWLHRTRIEQAKKMLVMTDLKHYQIAEKVGYRDYKYFSQYFSKFCGCSAKEFRLRNLKQ